ncbi:hypothetical protein GCM10009075_04410 [Sphingomonas trueperi]
MDGRLAPERELEVRAWLAAHPEDAARCSACRAQKDALREALRGVTEEPLPAALNLRVRVARRARWTALSPAAVAAGAVFGTAPEADLHGAANIVRSPLARI